MTWFDGTMLINIGAVCYIIAFALRGELSLRALTLLGNIFYIVYYLTVPEVTLWFAIASTVLMTVANIVVMARIALERTTWQMTEKDKNLYRDFANFSPGQFRRLLKIAETVHPEEGHMILRGGEATDKLHYIVSGEAQIIKNGEIFLLHPSNFMGEIAWLLNGPATADVIARENIEILTWDKAMLNTLCQKWPDIDNALRARINQDLARKLSGSVQHSPAVTPA
ncbi:cyclic nucleotide-binding domain-containing protein [Parasphingorhabdus sp. DH2-15]|uniref:cyclic nucleotide-binding domain-containing protein n=1 Tax=Parasphingorhabdus sp. DH2-15 TaxID=3444112 RepID=UPI003F68785E